MVLENCVLSAHMTLKKKQKPNYQKCSFSVGLSAIGMWWTSDIRTLTRVQHKSLRATRFHSSNGLCELCLTGQLLVLCVVPAWRESCFKPRRGCRRSTRDTETLSAVLAPVLIPDILHMPEVVSVSLPDVFLPRSFTAHLCSQRCQNCVAEMLSVWVCQLD